MLRWTMLCLFILAPSAGHGFEKLQDKDDLLAALNGRALTMGLFNLSLVLGEDGSITGSAMGWGVTGAWRWQDDLFCREIDWSGMPIAANCQLVEAAGDKMRFTSDAGQGQSAVFTLR
ncbi:MAG: dihydrodipicolinate reductase [Cypionkella sp.]